jgi:ABC-type dipeptide/oligopeptide/nickel transport system permease subunit
MLDHTEPKLEEPMVQAQTEDFANLVLNQGNPRCIPPIILAFSFNLYNYILLDCAFKFIGIE